MIALSRETRTLVQAFEEAWYEEEPPDLESFYKSRRDEIPEEEWDPFLHWLVRVDMEIRIRRRHSPNGPTVIFLDNYARRHSAAFDPDKVPDDLLVWDYMARLQSGSVPDLEEILEKYSASDRLSDIANRLAEELKDGGNNCLPTIPGYVIISEIGRGGMGVVYSALETRLNRKVAIKLILPHRYGGVIDERFMREAATLAKLDSEKFVPIYDVGVATTPQDCPYFTMRLIPGKDGERPLTLHNALTLRANLDDNLEHWLRVFVEVCDAVAIAHGNRGAPILHRDLKPSNIVLDVNGRPWVIDWGLAKHWTPHDVVELDSSLMSDLFESVEEDDVALTREGMIVGTPSYMSPEQANAHHELVNTTSDVFSLGGILCTILTGMPPYQAKSPDELLEKAQSADQQACRERLKATPDTYLAEVALNALNPRPGARYKTAAEMRDALEYWFTSRTMRERQEEMVVAKRPLKRALGYLVLIAIGLLLIGAAGYGWRFYESHQREISRQGEVAKAEESIEDRLARVESDIAAGEITSAAQTLKDISALKRDDLPQPILERIDTAERLVQFLLSAEMLTEERVLLQLDANLSATKLIDQFKQLLRQVGFSEVGADSELRAATPLFKSNVVLVANELVQLLPIDQKQGWIDAMTKLDSEAIPLRLRRIEDPLPTDELTKMVAALNSAEFKPGVLELLLRANARSRSDAVQTLRVLEFNNRNNFWLSLYLAIGFATQNNAGNVDLADRQKSQAVLWARTALGQRPDSAVAMLILAHILNSDDQQELDRLAAAMHQHHPDSWMRYYVDSKAKLAVADARGAVDCLDDALKVKGPDSFLWMQQAQLLMALGEVDRAREILDVKLKDAEKTVQVLCLKAICYLRLEQFTHARSVCDQLADLYPNDSRSQIVRAIVIAGMGRVLEANALYATIDVDHVNDADYYIAGLVPDMAAGDLESVYDRATFLSRYGKGFDYWFIKGMLDGSLGRFVDSQEDYQRAHAWLERQNGRTFTIMGLQVSSQLPVLLLVENWYASLDESLDDLSPEEVLARCTQEVKQPVIGRLKIYVGEYLAIRGEHAMAIDLFENNMPPFAPSGTLDVNDVPAVITRIRTLFGLPPSADKSPDLQKLSVELQTKLASCTVEEQKEMVLKFFELVNEMDLGNLPSTQGMQNLRLSAARSACLAAAGKTRGRIADDQSRRHWRSLGLAYLKNELQNCQRLDMSKGNPLAERNQISVSHRLGQMLAHRDFEILRNPAEHLSDPKEIAELEAFWQNVRTVYDQVGEN